MIIPLLICSRRRLAAVVGNPRGTHIEDEALSIMDEASFFYLNKEIYFKY